MSRKVTPANIHTSLADAWVEIDKLKRLFTQPAGVASLAHQEAKYKMPLPGSVTVASTMSAALEWDHREGDAILDLTVVATPVVITAGWYTVDISFSSTSPVWTVGACINGVLRFHQGAWAGFLMKEAVDKTPTGANDLPSAGDLDVPRGFVSLTAWLEPGDQMTFQIDNLDNADRDLTVDEAHVSLLYLVNS